MKIRLTIELDLPADWTDWTDAELRQSVFDSYVNFNTVAHMEEAMNRYGDAELDGCAALMAYNHHRDWGDVSRTAVFTVEKI